jgi:thymidylate synthase
MLKNALNTLKKRRFENDIIHHEENQYLNLIDDILNEGEMVEGRNGKTLTVFGSSMNFSLENNDLPLLTTKKVAWKTCLKELVWFINGSTDNEILQKQNVKIWNGNASREYLDSVGMTERNENDLGPVYGHQWRFFNAKYSDCKQDYTGQGIDQLINIIKDLKDNKKKYSRRLIMSAWNPCQLDEMALPPCHVLVQFNVLPGDKLSCSLYQRSGDVGLGVPFNIASYSMLTHILAKHCGLNACEFNYHLGNAHIYDDHIEKLKLQIKRQPRVFPKINILNKHDNINDYSIEDIELIDYTHHESLIMDMRK